MTMNTYVKNMGTLSLPLDPSLSGLLLQGGKGFSHSSSKKSSAKGVWQVRKEKKMKENRIFSNKLPQIQFLIKIQSLEFQAILLIQITK